MKFMIHMDNRQADNVCLITYPFGPEHQSSNSLMYTDAQEAMSCFQSHFRLRSMLHVSVKQTVNIKYTFQTHNLLRHKLQI